jgi:AbrB family looped-hinge helix DNA binding protein
MEIAAKMSSKGQVTVPKAVREALGIAEGDVVVFRVEGNRAVLESFKCEAVGLRQRSCCAARSPADDLGGRQRPCRDLRRSTGCSG